MNTPGMAKSNSFANFMSYLGGIIPVIFWGLSFVSTKILMVDGGLSPTESYIYRFAIAYIVMVILSHNRLFANNWHDEFLFLLCGLSSGSIYFIAENMSLELTLASNVSLLTSTTPLVTILIVGLLYKNDRPGLGVVMGSLVAFCGVVCVIFNSMGAGSEHGGNPWGDLLALGSAVCWSVYSLILKRLNVFYSPLFITRKAFFYGVVTALPFLLLQPSVTPVSAVLSNKIVLFNLVFLALGASIISYFLWAITIEKLGAVKTNNLMYFQTIVTMIASAIILGESITMMGVLGLVLILFGLWLGDYLQAKIKKKR